MRSIPPPFKKGSRTKTVIAALLTAVFLWSLTEVAHRIRSEAGNRTVEICLDWDETTTLCRLNGYPLNDFLERARAIGVHSFALGEETLGSLAGAGDVIYFPNAEYQRLRLLDIVPPGAMVGPDMFAVPDETLAQNIAQQLTLRYAVPVKTAKAGKYRLIYPSVDAVTGGVLTDVLALGFSPAKRGAISGRGFKVVLKPRSDGNPRWIAATAGPDVSGYLFDAREIPGYPGGESTVIQVFRENGKLFALEFVPVSGIDTMKRALPDRVVAAHTVPSAELDRDLDPSTWVARWKRAVQERGNRFLLFRFWDQRSVEDNLTYLRMTAQALKRSGYTLGESTPPAYPQRGNSRVWVLLAGACAVVLPLIGLSAALKFRTAIVSFLVANAFSVSAGILISALLFDAIFMQRIMTYPAVKLTMVLPIVLSVFLLYRPAELKRFWNEPVKVKYAAAAFLVALATALILVRSGNTAGEWLHPDQGMRRLLEDIFAVRPRTKEFLLGQPLLYIGFLLARPELILLGMIGQVSVINTFLHAHTPVTVSLLRSVYGMALGLLVALAVLGAFSLARRVLGLAGGLSKKTGPHDG